MEALKKQRAVVKGSMTRVKTFVLANENVTTVDISEYETRELFLEKAFQDYCTIQENLEAIDEDEGMDRGDVESNYLTILSKLKSKIKQFNQVAAVNLQQSLAQAMPTSAGVGAQTNARLPSVNIPSFSGKIEDWQAFIDLFLAVIDGHSYLDNVQKFLYLKGALAGEALNLINNLPLTNDNYTQALDLLKNRYENKLAVINSHLKGMLDTPEIPKGTGKQLRAFLTHVRQHVNSLKALKLPVKEWDVLLVFLFSQKLDYQTHKAYELEKSIGQRASGVQSVLPTLDDFLAFLESRCIALENIEVENVKGVNNHGSGVRDRRGDRFGDKNIKNVLLSEEDPPHTGPKTKCYFCNRDNHSIYKCYKFINLSLSDKRQFIQVNRLCYNCLGNTHGVVQCQIKQGCKTCHKRHHTLLHDDMPTNTSGANQNNSRQNINKEHNDNKSQGNTLLGTIQDPFIGISHGVNLGISRDESEVQQTVMTCSKRSNFQVLLATANINLILKDGSKVQARALLDSGSQTSFITKQLFKKLKNAESYNTSFKIGGIGNKISQVDTVVKLTLESHVNNYQLNTKCAVLEKITCKLPHVWVDTEKLKIGKDIKLADPFYFKPGDIDMLISADVYFQIILPEIINLGTGLPILQNSEFGWLVCGTAPIDVHNKASACFLGCANVDLHCETDLVDVNETIPKFWQLEEVSNNTFLSRDEKLCEKLFLDSCKRLDNGVFQVDLPMRNKLDYLKLGDSFYAAYKRFQFLEAKLSKNPQLFADYKDFINEYVELNHGKYIVCDSDDLQNRVFLAHHCVIREESSSTKLRVVFDASSKTSTGLSLNDIMLKGFTVQPELFDILMRFRMYEFVLVSDIKKMYRMIKINPEQLFLQNILWRESPNGPIQVIELQTVTYGTKAAPFLATRCLNKLATDENLNFPLASDAILNQCYVDDILCGANSKKEVMELRKQLIAMLQSGGFYLHKWLSNDLTILDSGESGENKTHGELNVFNENGKVLGIAWHPIHDSFKISVPDFDIGNAKVTKRLVLSKISQMFDPMGYVGPVVVTAKILMQQIWVSKISWDDELPAVLLEKWENFSHSLHCLCQLQIPRWVFNSKEIVGIQLHGFSDASMVAYGACVYIRAIYTDNSVTCNLLCSKSRIAPIKTVSLPRLELCGALLLSRLIHRVLSIVQTKISDVYLWTDSSIVLCWLKGAPSRWTTFVANRIAEMQELTTNFVWNHIRSQENPADHISRGIPASEIQGNKLWWHGPQFLLNFESSFSSSDQLNVTNLPEQKEQVALAQTSIDPEIKWHNFSNFARLIRAVAYCHKFANRVYGQISVEEQQQAHKTIIKFVQLECFRKEIEYLKLKGNSTSVFKESQIICLNPFLDEDGILRINGRLAQANMSFTQKFPILLPANHYVVKLIIRFEHLKLFHAGPQAVLANLRLKYWIIHGLVKVKSVVHECVICHRLKAKGAAQMMGSLPADRISVARPFLKVGVDFGGPLTIKQSRLRKAVTSKAYIALFVCMVTKAVHVEVVSSLTTEAFIHTFKRFIARRGCPATIYSDNATNFQGANNLLRDVYLFFKDQKNLSELHNLLVDREIEWRFIPPSSPHWGGLWEAGIKSTKFHLRRIVGNITLTFEELTTVLAQIEAILNSRPLCPISSDPSDLECLTPSHFLIGEPLTSFPEKDVSTIPENRLNFYQLCVKIKQNFWKRWSVEYLTRLQNRPKWFSAVKNLEENTMVLLKEDNVPPLKWPLGRIVKVMPGADGRVRVVQVKTKDGLFTRPITKLSPLPFDSN